MESKLLGELATNYQMDPKEFIGAVKIQCFAGGACSDAQLLMLLSFAREYKLNPLARECYAFVGKDGKTQIGVQVDGWTKIADRPDYDGQDTEYELDKEGTVIAIVSRTYIMGRNHPVVYRAVMSEWYRDTPVWKSMPSHQLYVKARNMGIRFAFGISAYDPDDLERIAQAQVIETHAEVVKEITETFPGAVEVKPVPEPEPVPRRRGVKVERASGAEGKEAEVSGGAEPAQAPAAVAESVTNQGKPLTLEAFIAAHDVPKKRVDLALAKYGAASIAELDAEQAAAVLAVFTKSYGGAK